MPADHPLRRSLNAEIHARPTPALPTPSKISYLVLLSTEDSLATEWDNMRELASMVGVSAPEPDGNYHALQFGDMWVIWERHTEFTRYTVIWTKPNAGTTTALSKLPKLWVSGLPNKLLLLSHCDLLAGEGAAEAQEIFGERDYAGSLIADGHAAVFTDFDITADGSNYCLIVDRALTPLQAGRSVVRILEIYTYWMMALLALPVAKELSPFLRMREELTRTLSRQLSQASDSAEETELLAELTSLEAELSESAAEHDFRFSAAKAYQKIVQQRIEDLREERVPGLQSIKEFSQKRLAPAMQTCLNVADRQTSLNVHTNRLARLLATRIDVNVQNQNREVLKSLDNRAALQLRLQQTVEGLSIAAITYYVVGLVKYAATAIIEAGVPLNEHLTVGLAIPVVALAVGLSIRRVRRRLDRKSLE